MLEPDDSALLLQLGDTASGVSGWTGFLRSVAARFQTNAATLFLSRAYWTWDHGHAPPPSPDAAHDVPIPQLFAGLRPSRVYSGEELHDRALAQEAVWLGAENRALALKCHNGPACLLLRRDSGVFRAADTARLASYAPHLAQALDLWHRMHAAEIQRHRAEELARRIGVGRLVLDMRKAEILDMDAVAANLLAESGRDASSLIGAAQAYTAPAVVLLPAGLDMLILPDRSAAHCVTAYVRHINAPLPDPALIAAALGISRAEARLARALGEGASLIDAAAQLGLTVETARNYSKRIYARTGLRGQAALVRHMWCSTLSLGR
ncbi:helix-turn-helix transcriptional regulator [Roseinatronobacter alkalisoli]|uniref:HTH luxR-type domain-containing protein n=1 Tax=Roseinatronobacter alkalisoli TaxID=3028235 RepID=A0ABT5T7S3_9RHOB|nr:hypothetical protein [Roseinatronobacter sp. HJB301]MDD7971171.1 hypothetical protein [Roseinatronobacter sp. HJB301]